MTTFRPRCGPMSRPFSRKMLMSRIREWLIKILLRKEVNVMAVIYATLIVKGLKTLEQVPSLIKVQVQEILTALEVEL